MKDNIGNIFDRTFDKMNLPSQGQFYEDGMQSLNVRYLAGIEEKVLTSYFLNESGEGLEMVLNNLILDDIDVKDLVVQDVQGIMMYLYSTAYGDKIPYNITCGNCGTESELPIRLSSLDFKKPEYNPIDGKYIYYTKYEKSFLQSGYTANTVSLDGIDGEFVKIEISPLTFGDDLEIKSRDEASQRVMKIVKQIKSIGGIEDHQYKFKAVKNMMVMDFKKLRKFIEDNEASVDDNVSLECPVCNHENKVKLSLGYNFLKLPESHKQVIMDECFLISHYGESGMSFKDAMSMPISERRWYLNRTAEEIDKKREAEKKAADRAKAQSQNKGR